MRLRNSAIIADYHLINNTYWTRPAASRIITAYSRLRSVDGGADVSQKDSCSCEQQNSRRQAIGAFHISKNDTGATLGRAFVHRAQPPSFRSCPGNDGFLGSANAHGYV